MRYPLKRCPVCQDELTITRLRCEACDITLEGRFDWDVFSRLTPEQMRFLLVFIRHEGKLTRMEEEMNLSYPTLRNRLHDIIRALGYEPGKENAAELDEERRRKVLEDLDAGRLSADEAMRLLRGEEA
ncbi:MAG: DUF2089 domain-containing protein [Anaerolineales bacterium]|nr:DUF2089 domain-containing protein [Anaerolineales bacterium]MCX7754414.1 DUF2089 domain-containing protein [Anaerolineales bacterium]MDW8276528.1 DUF2089 domain-containing protein [Anaerolineales bacterium]